MDYKLTSYSNPDFLKHLQHINRGIEKEGLRVAPSGEMAKTPHPVELGSALTNTWVTTDFSEALIEFITPICHKPEDLIEKLLTAHHLALGYLANEYIWPASMPGVLPKDEEIPLAQYGSSNVGQMKTVYRRGLGHRYGRAMQTVAGIHYNFSLPESYWQYEISQNNLTLSQSETREYINKRYLALIRNFRRYYWLLVYLFGASPCIDKSFVQGRLHNLQKLNDSDFYLEYATSLRMGDLGYQSNAQKQLFICYNELSTYISTLNEAIVRPYKNYETIGLIKKGVHQQLSTALLQIENEFYSPIRPKRVTLSGEKPLHALASRGIEYIEVRCMDINPELPLGIDTKTICFLDAFLLTCLNEPSAFCDHEEFSQISENQSRVVNYGRKKDLTIYLGKTPVNMNNFAERFLDKIQLSADALDNANNTNCYSESVSIQRDKVLNPDKTPSAILLNGTKSSDSFINKNLCLAKEHKSFILNNKVDNQYLELLNQDSKDSLDKQKEIEEADIMSFSEYLQAYFNR